MEVFERIPYSPRFPEAKLEVLSIIAKPQPSIISWSLFEVRLTSYVSQYWKEQRSKRDRLQRSRIRSGVLTRWDFIRADQ